MSRRVAFLSLGMAALLSVPHFIMNEQKKQAKNQKMEAFIATAINTAMQKQLDRGDASADFNEFYGAKAKLRVIDFIENTENFPFEKNSSIAFSKKIPANVDILLLADSDNSFLGFRVSFPPGTLERIRNKEKIDPVQSLLQVTYVMPSRASFHRARPVRSPAMDIAHRYYHSMDDRVKIWRNMIEASKQPQGLQNSL